MPMQTARRPAEQVLAHPVLGNAMGGHGIAKGARLRSGGPRSLRGGRTVEEGCRENENYGHIRNSSPSLRLVPWSEPGSRAHHCVNTVVPGIWSAGSPSPDHANVLKSIRYTPEQSFAGAG